jgi:hypothetical protein
LGLNRGELGWKEEDVRLGIGIDLEGRFTPETVGDSVWVSWG